MDDEKCILVEFVNESNKVAVGFIEWCNLADEEIQQHIKDEDVVQINWPNCDVGPAVSMKKKMKKCSFKVQAVKIRAQGGTYTHTHTHAHTCARAPILLSNTTNHVIELY